MSGRFTGYMNSGGYILKAAFATALAAVGLLITLLQASAEDCGDVSIARMGWQSSALIAFLDQIILSEGYGCNTRLVPGDTLPTFDSMVSTGRPDVAPEFWINSVRDRFDEAVSNGELEIAAQSLSDGGVEGWWIPNFIAEAYPEIKSIEDALKRPELFSGSPDENTGIVHGCPPGWSCRISTQNLFKAYGAEDKGFELKEPETPEEQAESIDRAFAENRGWLGYYWAPTATLGKYEMVRLDFGVPHNQVEWNTCTSVANCFEPKPNAWPKSTVYSITTDDFRRNNPAAFAYLSKRAWNNSTVNGIMAWADDNNADPRDAAIHFLKTRPDLWTDWVTPNAAEQLKEFLAGS